MIFGFQIQILTNANLSRSNHLKKEILKKKDKRFPQKSLKNMARKGIVSSIYVSTVALGCNKMSANCNKFFPVNGLNCAIMIVVQHQNSASFPAVIREGGEPSTTQACVRELSSGFCLCNINKQCTRIQRQTKLISSRLALSLRDLAIERRMNDVSGWIQNCVDHERGWGRISLDMHDDLCRLQSPARGRHRVRATGLLTSNFLFPFPTHMN